ncbi:MAG: hypothetical protein AB7P34_21800 [Vicinamibacterales bacterium]
MSAYDLDDERAIRTGRLVDDWTQSGLLTRAQRDVLMPQLAVDLRRTNLFLRITLFLFGGVILQSALGLGALFISGLADEAGAGLLCLAAGAGCFWLATLLVRRYNLYRFGVEEAVALTAAGLGAAGAAIVMSTAGGGELEAGLVVGAVVLTALYVHFGYVYCAVLAMALAAVLPFLIEGPEVVQRIVAVALLAAVAGGARAARAGHGDEYPGDSLAVIEAAAWLGIYALVNLAGWSGIRQIERAPLYYWTTYAAIWLLPAAGLYLALRGRERALLLASLAMALATLLSNKEYLGSPRYEWDPIVLGLLLMGVAIGVRRWLASGDGGQRHGYTAARLVASDQSHLGHLAIVSATHTDVPVAAAPPPGEPGLGGGGRSGGAGAGGSF